jgi:phosphatidylglycerophosphatase A
LVTLFGSFFYTGFAPIAPASFACLVWLVIYLFVPYGGYLAHWIALVIVLGPSIYLSRTMEGYFGTDASCIVIDEFVGMQITFLMVPPSIGAGLIGLVLFRVFDIVKPPPVGAAERIGGGVGVVLDDVVAGIYSRIVLLVLLRFLPIG